MVSVFANKQPTRVGNVVMAIITRGIRCEELAHTNRNEKAGACSRLARASVLCVARLQETPDTARPGWDNQVLRGDAPEHRRQLREFWDAGIRGPDFVWAATGPALEAYSKHPVVKKANDPGQLMSVSEFLTHVRRMVVDFVVGRVLAGDQEDADNLAMAERLDEPTAYYLLHRNDFHLEEAPLERVFFMRFHAAFPIENLPILGT